MNAHSIIDGIDYGLLAALVGTWRGDKRSFDHRDLNTLSRVS
tara:strand:- start:450 stop:575 length:126 start_codon:yes stop_codon:yes gene_type:complete